ncbi:MAG: HIT domain-containing protein [archaeon]
MAKKKNCDKSNGDCIFCKFTKGEMQAPIVYEDKNVLAFLDISPAGALEGHTLVLPKKHFVDIEDCAEADLKQVACAIKKIIPAIKKVSGADGINILQNNGKCAGQYVMHLHFHLIPRKQGDGIWFETKRREAKPLELTEVAIQIKNEIKQKNQTPPTPKRAQRKEKTQ